VNKKITVLLIALVVLLGIIFLTSNNRIDVQQPQKNRDFFANVLKSDIEKVVIAKEADTIIIKEVAGSWFVSSPAPEAAASDTGPALAVAADAASSEQKLPADSSSVDQMLSKIVDMKRDDLISQNPDKQSTFEVDAASGTYVEVFDKQQKSIGKFYIGKTGPSYQSHYVRMVGSDDVYTVGGSIKYSFFTDQKRWSDKRVQSIAQSEIESFTVVHNQDTAYTATFFTDTAQAKVWHFAGDSTDTIASQKINPILTELSSMSASEVVAATESTLELAGLQEPLTTILTTTVGGKQHQLHLGAKEQSTQWVASSQHPDYIYKVATSKIDKFPLQKDGFTSKE